ncbi:AtpZ/AtpI family protein [Lipingzhangella sp. LS1_29]|uniref:AtpZ/AtpI family protein n=1 Tax=Lipingzhangella rawalii TaxID=2055835 RepID=A0ABU2H580_9ACTN|nr:AtpZ/AtpI family protein [Lipingzhangella rawalii]MDS1270464.1 AtpZ/AtpI family protein [Lipingzhangella rawalii]
MSDRPAEHGEPRDSAQPRAADGWNTFSLLLSGILVWGGIGWGLDALLGFEVLFLPIGIVLGMVGAIYLVWAQVTRS